MSARRLVQFALLGICAVCFAFSSPLRAQDTPQSDIDNARFSFTGVVNSNAVFVRSGPSENDYPTGKLDKGAEVTVVGERFQWLKVLPPEGSFCYVAKAFVDRRGTGATGRVTSTLNVRVGSQLNELKAKIASKLEPGADVEILGEEQEYFKIKPPAGVYFYVNKQFVDPVRPANIADAGQAPQVTDPLPPTETAQDTQPIVPPISESSVPDKSTSMDTAPPIDAPLKLTEAPPPSPATQPSSEAELEFDRLEAQYAECSLKPLDEQPVSQLLEGYQKLANSDKLPESLRRIAEFKADVLKARLEVQQQFAETRQHMDAMKQKQMALNAEREELEQRVKDADFKFYTAVGTLRPSSLQVGSETLFRLTDPANGRTIVYVRSNDTKFAAMIGQFIGVKGDVQTDQQMNLRIISPTAFELVNPAKVGQTVAAQIVPSSLLPGGSTARTE